MNCSNKSPITWIVGIAIVAVVLYFIMQSDMFRSRMPMSVPVVEMPVIDTSMDVVTGEEIVDDNGEGMYEEMIEMEEEAA